MLANRSRIASIAAWILAAVLVALVVYLGWNRLERPSQAARIVPATTHLPQSVSDESSGASLSIPKIITSSEMASIYRQDSFHTIIPTRPRQDVQDYTIAQGDSLFEVARQFNVKPETLLWANYDLLNDNPDLVSVGMDLKIPPVDGVYYQWQEGDTLEGVAGRFEAKVADILAWPANDLDLTNPVIEPGTWIMVPGGHREFRQWIIPVIPRGQAGVSRELYGAGACEGNYDGAFGSGAFVWPAGNHSLSGNDYWSGHLGIDIAAGEGATIGAADAGVVVFAGWANGGYGNMVMIDHGNGYQTLYAHLSQVSVSCGRSVGQGQTIGYAGSTGNSTGAHLHFEVRYMGGFVDPWYVLPAP